jgi:hypothetical protein
MNRKNPYHVLKNPRANIYPLAPHHRVRKITYVEVTQSTGKELGTREWHYL